MNSCSCVCCRPRPPRPPPHPLGPPAGRQSSSCVRIMAAPRGGGSAQHPAEATLPLPQPGTPRNKSTPDPHSIHHLQERTARMLTVRQQLWGRGVQVSPHSRRLTRGRYRGVRFLSLWSNSSEVSGSMKPADLGQSFRGGRGQNSPETLEEHKSDDII